MRTNMKKLAACILALLLVVQMVPVMAAEISSNEIQPDPEAFRDHLKITSKSKILIVGDELQLEWTDGFELEWESSDKEIATVSDGLVTAIAPGKVKITATEKGKNGQNYSDSITLKVVGKSGSNNNGGETGNENQETGEATANDKMIVIINVDKTKVTYDGKEHTASYEASSSSEDFDESKVKVNEGKLFTKVDCGTYPVHYEDTDFTYTDSSKEVEFVISDGWLQIKPVVATLTIDNKTQTLSGGIPELTATVSGLLEGDDPSIIKYELTTLPSGSTTYIVPNEDFQSIQGHYKVEVVKGILTTPITSPLYNLAVINNTWYRLDKTEITTEKTVEEFLTGITKAGTNVTLKDTEYKAEPYDFENQIIKVNNKRYAYCTMMGKVDNIDGYYSASLREVETVVAVKQKIGGGGNSPRWLVENGDKYTEKDTTDSFHRNYEIKLVDSTVLIEQEAYNMLSVNGGKDYYKLRKSTINAIAFDKMTVGKELNSGDYALTQYDFDNVVLVIDGEEYKYSDHVLTGEYESYFTVKFKNVMRENRFNGNAEWFKKTEGWLDGSLEQYGNLSNNTDGIHVNYVATTHKGTKPKRKVTITSDWPEGKIAYPGAVITLTASLVGFGENVTFQWQYSTDGENWIDEPDANEITFTYILNEETARYYWRVVANE